MKIVKTIQPKIVIFTDVKNRCMLHGRVFAMVSSPMSCDYHLVRECGGLVVNVSDSGSRGRGFEPHSGQTVLCP